MTSPPPRHGLPPPEGVPPGGPVRTFSSGRFAAEALARAKHGKRVSVCLPARDEEATVGAIVAGVRAHLVERVGLVDEVLVVDDHSADATARRAAEAGARVVAAPDGPGKGQALRTAVERSDGDLVVFLDADVTNFAPHFVVGLLGPLLVADDAGFVKASYGRALAGEAGQGGRVTELVARPLINLLFPHLAGVRQPLAGECAARREVLEAVPFVHGYGVELGLLVDVARRFGLASIVQVDLGERAHRNRPLAELAPQAEAVLRTAFARAGVEAPGLGPSAGAGAVAESPPLGRAPPAQEAS